MLTGGVIGMEIVISVPRLLVGAVLLPLVGLIYNWAINQISRERHVLTWVWVVVGVILCSIALAVFVHWAVAAAMLLYMACLGAPLILGDQARQKNALTGHIEWLNERKRQPIQ